MLQNNSGESWVRQLGITDLTVEEERFLSNPHIFNLTRAGERYIRSVLVEYHEKPRLFRYTFPFTFSRDAYFERVYRSLKEELESLSPGDQATALHRGGDLLFNPLESLLKASYTRGVEALLSLARYFPHNTYYSKTVFSQGYLLEACLLAKHGFCPVDAGIDQLIEMLPDPLKVQLSNSDIALFRKLLIFFRDSQSEFPALDQGPIGRLLSLYNLSQIEFSGSFQDLLTILSEALNDPFECVATYAAELIVDLIVDHPSGFVSSSEFRSSIRLVEPETSALRELLLNAMEANQRSRVRQVILQSWAHRECFVEPRILEAIIKVLATPALSPALVEAAVAATRPNHALWLQSADSEELKRVKRLLSAILALSNHTRFSCLQEFFLAAPRKLIPLFQDLYNKAVKDSPIRLKILCLWDQFIPSIEKAEECERELQARIEMADLGLDGVHEESIQLLPRGSAPVAIPISAIAMDDWLRKVLLNELNSTIKEHRDVATNLLKECVRADMKECRRFGVTKHQRFGVGQCSDYFYDRIKELADERPLSTAQELLNTFNKYKKEAPGVLGRLSQLFCRPGPKSGQPYSGEKLKVK